METKFNKPLVSLSEGFTMKCMKESVKVVKERINAKKVSDI